MANTNLSSRPDRSLLVPVSRIDELALLSDKLGLLGDMIVAVKAESLNLSVKSLNALAAFLFEASETLDRACASAHKVGGDGHE